MPYELKVICMMIGLPILLAFAFIISKIISCWPKPKPCPECGKSVSMFTRSRMCPSRHLKCQEIVINRMMKNPNQRLVVKNLMREWKERNYKPGEYVVVQPERGEPIVWAE